MSEEDKKHAEAVREALSKVGKELDTTRGKDLEWRRRHFKMLLLQWHPDKNQSPIATDVFRHLMARRASYLDA